MTIDDKAREDIAKARQQDQHLVDSMRGRTADELEKPATADDQLVEEQAREELAEDRQRQEHLHETMLERSEHESTQSR